MEDSQCNFLLFFIRRLDVETFWPIAIVTARVLTQALSNMVTANDPLIARLWESYMNLPDDQVVLMFVHVISLNDCNSSHEFHQPIARIPGSTVSADDYDLHS